MSMESSNPRRWPYWLVGAVLTLVALGLFAKGWFAISPDDVAYLEAGGLGSNVPDPWPWIIAAAVTACMGFALLLRNELTRSPAR
ncbi:hypothetical protein [Demequina aurantiaca]|uniref:hypothetical protein n=1 Tax=Demequina aurantiaca TaxID=676200 RepID=UPI003D357C6B